MLRVVCDVHGAALDGLGRCVTFSPTGAGQWHRPDVLDTREVVDLDYGPSEFEVSWVRCAGGCGLVFSPRGMSTAPGMAIEAAHWVEEVTG